MAIDKRKTSAIMHSSSMSGAVGKGMVAAGVGTMGIWFLAALIPFVGVFGLGVALTLVGLFMME